VCRRSTGWRKGADNEKNRSLGDMRAIVPGSASDLGPNGYPGGAPSSSPRGGGGWATSRCRIRLD
jgi:hypothetical protein